MTSIDYQFYGIVRLEFATLTVCFSHCTWVINSFWQLSDTRVSSLTCTMVPCHFCRSWILLFVCFYFVFFAVYSFSGSITFSSLICWTYVMTQVFWPLVKPSSLLETNGRSDFWMSLQGIQRENVPDRGLPLLCSNYTHWNLFEVVFWHEFRFIFKFTVGVYLWSVHGEMNNPQSKERVFEPVGLEDVINSKWVSVNHVI